MCGRHRHLLPVPEQSKPKFAMGHFQFVAMMAMIGAIQALGIDAMLPALGLIANELDVPDPNDRQFVLGIYMIGMAVGALAIGFLADRYGRRIVTISAIALYALLNIACGLAKDFTILLGLRFLTGVVSAGGGVMSITIIRDRFYGDRMASVQSLVAIVFMAVPILAPALGQLVLMFGGWREIFFVMAAMSAALTVWVALLLPETLDDANRQPIAPLTLFRNFGVVARNRDAFGYMVGSALVMGGLFGFINTAQQLLMSHFGVGGSFALIFGVMASSLVVTNFVNSRIVEKHGARRVSHAAILIFIAAAAGQVIAAIVAPDSLALFMILMMLNLAMFGFLGANFTSIALQPFGRLAGAAASLQTTMRTGGGALLGIAIGAAYDGTALPLAASMVVLAVIALAFVAFSEGGKLFRRRSEAIAQV